MADFLKLVERNVQSFIYNGKWRHHMSYVHQRLVAVPEHVLCDDLCGPDHVMFVTNVWHEFDQPVELAIGSPVEPQQQLTIVHKAKNDKLCLTDTGRVCFRKNDEFTIYTDGLVPSAGLSGALVLDVPRRTAVGLVMGCDPNVAAPDGFTRCVTCRSFDQARLVPGK
jgi:hypothetical protein